MDECGRCEDLERSLNEAFSRIDELENDVDDWQSQYHDVDTDAEHYMMVAQNLVTLVRKIGQEIPHIYMLLEFDTFNEMKEWIDKEVE